MLKYYSKTDGHEVEAIFYWLDSRPIYRFANLRGINIRKWIENKYGEIFIPIDSINHLILPKNNFLVKIGDEFKIMTIDEFNHNYKRSNN